MKASLIEVMPVMTPKQTPSLKQNQMTTEITSVQKNQTSKPLKIVYLQPDQITLSKASKEKLSKEIEEQEQISEKTAVVEEE